MLVFVSHSDTSEGQHNNKATESVAGAGAYDFYFEGSE